MAVWHGCVVSHTPHPLATDTRPKTASHRVLLGSRPTSAPTRRNGGRWCRRGDRELRACRCPALRVASQSFLLFEKGNLLTQSGRLPGQRNRLSQKSAQESGQRGFPLPCVRQSYIKGSQSQQRLPPPSYNLPRKGGILLQPRPCLGVGGWGRGSWRGHAQHPYLGDSGGLLGKAWLGEDPPGSFTHSVWGERRWGGALPLTRMPAGGGEPLQMQVFG